MKVIRINERNRNPDGTFDAGVTFGENAEYGVRVIDPANCSTEKLLAWYFEEHLRFPFLDLDRERQAEAALINYGEELFAQVFDGPANANYRTLRESSFDNCRIEINGSADFNLLHWEALRDPELGAPLAVRLPLSRRVDLLMSRFELPAKHTTLNILLVSARPFGPRDVGYRTISRPLMDRIRQSRLPVTIDMVRPGTWRALCKDLETAKEQHGSGWYHIIHFDLHGGFSDFIQRSSKRLRDRFAFQSIPVKPFDGKRPFLFFETADEGTADLIPAEAIASLLAEHRIPVAILNACQSAQQVNSEASLAQQLVQAGVPLAVGMAYSITVTAAVQAMVTLYEQLTQRADLEAASYAARRSLYENRSRRAYFDKQIDLEDWMLPVVFQQRPLKLRLEQMDDRARADFYQRQSDVGSEPSTAYGFVGRDLDILAIERRLLTSKDNNELLVQGMVGAGKSTLLRHLAWWWQRTGLIDKTFWFSYEERAWTCGQIIKDISSRLFSNEEQASFEMRPDSAQLELVSHRLRASRHLFVLDNAESIAGPSATTPHALASDKRAELKTLMSRLRGGETLVLVGSREAETWLAQEGFGGNTYTLSGLDPQATSTLVGRILQRNKATHWLNDRTERSAMQRLVKFLDGYPLAITTVLPILRNLAPSTVLAELRGELRADRATQIINAVEYCYGKLEPTLQNSILLLAPFTNVVPRGPALEEYRNRLSEAEAVRSLGELDLPGAISEAVKVGLARPHPRFAEMVLAHPLLPTLLRNHLMQYDDNLRMAVAQAHYEQYYYLGGLMFHLLTSREDSEAHSLGRAVIRAEYANLTTALAFALKRAKPVTDLIRPLEEYLDQEKQQAARRELIDETIRGYSEPQSLPQRRELALLHFLAGYYALDQHRLSAAKEHFEKELELREDKEKAWTYRNLGRVAREQRQFQEAEVSYRKALDAFLAMDEPYGVALTYHQLGMLAQDRRRFHEAKELYQKALEIQLEFKYRRDSASTYSQLGSLAQEQRHYAEAESSYRKALEIYVEFGAQSDIGWVYHQLGISAYERQQLDNAQDHFRRALKTKLAYGDRRGSALTYHELGIVFQAQERFDEAETNYHKALDIKNEFNDRYGAASTYDQLGKLAARQRKLDEAEGSFRAALEIFDEFNDRHGAAGVYNQLGALAMERQRYDEAEIGFRAALKFFREVNDGRNASIAANNLEQLKAKVIDVLRRTAMAGDTEAMYGLGNMLVEARKEIEAEEWFRSAASKGHAAAMFNLGMMVHARDAVTAEQWLRRAAEKGHDYAMNNLGVLLRETNPMEAEVWARRAAQTGNPEAMHNLGLLLQEGNRAEAELWLRRAADVGHARAMVVLGALASAAGRTDEAEGWWWRAADKGEARAIHNLRVRRHAMDSATYARWCRQAAEAGHAAAMDWLAILIWNTNPVEAEQWWQRAANRGYLDAMYNFGVVLKESGRIDQAQEWWQKAADHGDVQAIYNLGVLSQQSDPNQAEKLYRRAAEAGHVKAMRHLASLLQHADSAEAERWRTRAANAEQNLTELGKIPPSSA